MEDWGDWANASAASLSCFWNTNPCHSFSLRTRRWSFLFFLFFFYTFFYFSASALASFLDPLALPSPHIDFFLYCTSHSLLFFFFKVLLLFNEQFANAAFLSVVFHLRKKASVRDSFFFERFPLIKHKACIYSLITFHYTIDPLFCSLLPSESV